MTSSSRFGRDRDDEEISGLGYIASSTLLTSGMFGLLFEVGCVRCYVIVLDGNKIGENLFKTASERSLLSVKTDFI